MNEEEKTPGSLQGTLPAGGLSLDAGSLSLPDIDVKGLGSDELLALSLKQMAQLAKREGVATGGAAVSTFFSERGIKPEDLPGSSIAQMLAVVDQSMTNPIADRAQSIADTINAVRSSRDQIRSVAMNQISFLVNAGAWNGLGNVERQDLWESAGYSGVAPLIEEKASGSTTGLYNSLGRLSKDEQKAFWEEVDDNIKMYAGLYEREEISLSNIGTTVESRHGVKYPLREWVLEYLHVTKPADDFNKRRVELFGTSENITRDNIIESISMMMFPKPGMKEQSVSNKEIKQKYIDFYNDYVRGEGQNKIKKIKDVYDRIPGLEEAMDFLEIK